MKKIKFITEQMREETGKCTLIHDSIMQLLGIERMGFCQACNHEIKNHVGIKTSEDVYLYVGKCCAKILCDPDKSEVPAHGINFINDKGFNQVVVSKAYLKMIGDSIFHTEQITTKYDRYKPSFENGYSGAYYTNKHNQFIYSIYLQARESEKFNGKGIYTMSIKQYEALNKVDWIKEGVKGL